MKIKQTILVLMATIFIMLVIPNLTYAAITKEVFDERYLFSNSDFACSEPNNICGKFYSKDGHSTNRRKSLAGIFHAMRKDGKVWANSVAPKWPKSREGTWWATETGVDDLKLGSSDDGRDMIFRIGALCFGHRNETRKSGLAAGSWVYTFDIDENSSKEDLKAGYAAYKSHQEGETGGVSNRKWKSQIAKWIINKMKDAGAVVDNQEGSFKSLTSSEKTSMENYANEVDKVRKMEYKKTGNESISYKNGYTFIGPYHLNNYNGSIGNLTEAVITDANGNETKTVYGSLDGNTVQELKNIGSSSNAGYDFYVVVQGQTESVKAVKLYKEFKYYKARIVGTEPYKGGGLDGGGQNEAIFYGYQETGKVSIDLPGIPYSNMKIIKVDSNTGDKLANIGFIIYCEGQGYVQEGSPAKYVSKEQATIFRTNTKGEVEIKNLSKTGNYTIYEVINPYFGYEEVSMENPKNVGTVNITGAGGNAQTFTIKNTKEYIKISGYVWEDIISQKTSVRNGLWKNDTNDQEDKRVNNVKVTLKKADGTVLDTKTTSGEGSYIFGDYKNDPNAVKIKRTDLNGAYVEFEYNGMCYQSTTVNAGVSNGSKATDNNRRESFNNNYATVVNGQAQNPNGQKTYDLSYSYNNHVSTLNYGGNYVYGYDGQKYPISGINGQYLITANTKDASPNALLGQTDITMEELNTSNIEEIPNINLGLYEREMPDLAVLKDMYSARVSINGYNHVYQYDQRFVNQGAYGDGFNVGVKFGNEYGKQTYTRPIYKSDYDFQDSSNANNELGLRITYKIAIRNESTNITSRVNTVYDYFDSKYKLIGIGTGVATNGDITNAVSYTVEDYNSKYKRAVINPNISVGAQTQQYIYIQFELDRETIGSILFDANGAEIQDKILLDNSAEIASYSNFTKDGTRYAGIDKDSNPGTMRPEDRNTYEDDSDAAPGLMLVVANPRRIEGTVFVDSTTGELRVAEERIGDGIFTDGEQVVPNVKVRLYKEDGTLYRETSTDTNGNYSFQDFIPGRYKIVFTWGDQTYTVMDYKGTIYNEQERQNRTTWYLEKVDTRYSDAIDNYDTRLQIDSGENSEITTMDSTTPTMEFGVELNDIINNFAPTSGVDRVEFVVRNIDFGIVERPRQVLDVEKRATGIRLTLANGQVIVNAQIVEENGEYKLKGDTIGGTTYIPKGEVYPKNGMIRTELDNELIQGATITIDHSIVVKNNSELDYDTENYYKYGTDKQNVITITPEGVYDYIDNELAVGEESTDWEIKTNNSYYEEVSKPTVLEQYLYTYYKSEQTNQGIQEIIGYEEFQEIYQEAIANWTEETVIKARRTKLADKTILHNSNLEKTLKPGEQNTATLQSSKILSSTEEIELDNDIEIVEINREQRTGREVTPKYSTLYDKGETVVVTPPTGENNNYLPYVILGISCLVILGTGVVFIKKKLLK